MDFGSLAALLKLAAAVVVAVPLTAYLMQDKLIFQTRPLADAQRQAIAARHPDIADTFLQAADGTRLHAWHIKAPAGAPLVLYFGGNAENVAWMVDELPQHDMRVSWLLVDYRGYGASGGAPSERALVGDAFLWYDYAAKSGARLYLAGRSLGSGVAVQLAARRQFQGVILVTPFDSLVAVAERHYRVLPVRHLLRHRFDSLALAPRVGAPLLCIVATQDEVIPPEHARRLYDAWGGPKQLATLRAGHNSVDEQPEYWERMRAFLDAR